MKLHINHPNIVGQIKLFTHLKTYLEKKINKKSELNQLRNQKEATHLTKINTSKYSSISSKLK